MHCRSDLKGKQNPTQMNKQSQRYEAFWENETQKLSTQDFHLTYPTAIYLLAISQYSNTLINYISSKFLQI